MVDEDQMVLAVAATRYESHEDAEPDVEDARQEIADTSVSEIDFAIFEFHHTNDGGQGRLVNEIDNELGESIQIFESCAVAQEDLSAVKEFGADAWVSVA